MKIGTLSAMSLVVLLMFPVSAPRASERDAETVRQPIQLAQYVPPMRGAPKTRVGGATRGGSDEASYVTVLAPDHTGHTASERPTLYWYLTKSASDIRVELTLIDEDGFDPLLEFELKRQLPAGVQRLSLAEHALSLKPNIEYQWSVGIVRDPNERSKDIISSGTIRRIVLSAELTSKLQGLDGKPKAIAFAQNGLWYDAIEVISELIQDSPGDAELRRLRASFMEEVSLPEVAAYDRSGK